MVVALRVGNCLEKEHSMKSYLAFEVDLGCVKAVAENHPGMDRSMKSYLACLVEVRSVAAAGCREKDRSMENCPAFPEKEDRFAACPEVDRRKPYPEEERHKRIHSELKA